MAEAAVLPYTINVGDGVLTDLADRIHATRWPDPAPGRPWELGTDASYLRGLLAYWADGFDWPARERELNAFAHFRTELDGVPIHFVHARARGGHGIPLIATHGWPSTFAELLPLVPLLTDPAGHGIDGPAFDLVIPSLPGYGFSRRPDATAVNYRYVAGLWHRLMRRLGYARYGAHGTDFGSGVTTLMALDDPAPMIGVHLSNLEIPPWTGPASPPLSPAERAYTDRADAFWRDEGGYKEIQASRPQTLGYGLNDSPAGLAAWICEKWRSWSDSAGDLDKRIPRDLLLTTLTIFWATQTVTASMRDYYDNRRQAVAIGPGDFVDVPTGVAVFAHQFAADGEPPRAWAQRLYDVRSWTPMPRGGHFAAVEEPHLLARDIAAFFAGIR